MGIARFLIILVIVIVTMGLAWPWLSKLGLGRLPGDIVIERRKGTIYIPIGTSLVLSVVVTLILGLLAR